MPEHTVTFTTTDKPSTILAGLAKAGYGQITITIDGVEYLSPWSVECPRCYAPPGWPCAKPRSLDYGWLFCHRARTKVVMSDA